MTELAQSTIRRTRSITIDTDSNVVTSDRIFVHRSSKGFVCVGLGAGAELLRRAERMPGPPQAKRFGPVASRFGDPYLDRLVPLAKGYNADEARVPAGNPGGGEWTAGGVVASAASTAAGLFETNSASVTASLAAIASRLSGPTAFLGTLFIPTNRSLISNGAVPGNAAISFQFDRGEGVLTLSRSDDGSVFFSGRYGNDGVFRDSNGKAFGRVIDGALVLDPDTLPGYAAESNASVQSRPDARTQLEAGTDSRPKLCPDPGFDRPGSGYSLKALLYQVYVTGLQPGLAVTLHDPLTGDAVVFDGCRETDGKMLEAKGLRYKQFIDKNGDWRPWFKGLAKILIQVQRQSRAAGGRGVEWHVAEPEAAKAFAETIHELGVGNVTVIYDPMPATKILRSAYAKEFAP